MRRRDDTSHQSVILKTTYTAIANEWIHLQLAQDRERIEYATRQHRQLIVTQAPDDAVRPTGGMARVCSSHQFYIFLLSISLRYKLECPGCLVCFQLESFARTVRMPMTVSHKDTIQGVHIHTDIWYEGS